MAETKLENLSDEVLALAAVLGDLRSFETLGSCVGDSGQGRQIIV